MGSNKSQPSTIISQLSFELEQIWDHLVQQIGGPQEQKWPWICCTNLKAWLRSYCNATLHHYEKSFMFWTRANPRPFLFLRTPIFVGQSGHGRVGLIVDFDYSAEYQIVRLSKCIIFFRNQIVTMLDFSLIINSYLMLGLLPNDIII